MNRKGIIFDLDDTLFPEKEYVHSGFKVISIYLNEIYQINSEQSFNFLIRTFELNGRLKIFDSLLHKFMPHKTKAERKELVNKMVELYRNHSPDIKLNDEVIKILIEFRNLGWKISIVTDGLKLMQKNKINALGLNQLVDNVVYCFEHNSPKPSTLGFEMAAKEMGIDIENCLVVGDHPEKDIAPAIKLNSKAYRVRTERFANLEDNAFFAPINSFATLVDFFDKVINNENK